MFLSNAMKSHKNDFQCFGLLYSMCGTSPGTPGSILESFHMRDLNNHLKMGFGKKGPEFYMINTSFRIPDNN